MYANPQRCPQISLIDEQGVRVLYERQTEMAAEAVVLPTSKDPEVTARWIERCVAGVEPVPNSLKIQLACCLLACGGSDLAGAGPQPRQRLLVIGSAG